LLLNDLYTIESQVITDGQLLVAVKLNREHSIFKGHFPGHPVLPGVCMMEIISEILGEFFNRSFRISHVPIIKFLHMIDPNKNPAINLELKYQVDFLNVSTSGRIFSGSENFMKFQLTLLPDPV
jgi:3-hydroxyacyl-[acyl-carrier-protein] dehydratase